MPSMNAFRVLADVSHTASKCILIWAIHSNKSSEGVSLLTQVMYLFVFTARYLDLFWVNPKVSWWNFVLKIFYLSSSVYIIVLMRVFARTREREKAWKLAGYCTGGALIATPLINLIFRDRPRMTPSELSWSFSIILESVCVLPQLLLLRQTTVPTVIDSFYLVTLGSYRAFYVLNWIYRAATKSPPDPVSVIFGVIQTAFYLDFAWVYYTRQRVKLRGGGVVDADDLRKGWLINRFIPQHNETENDLEADEDGAGGEENNTTGRSRPINRWGSRGVSISADDTLADRDRRKAQNKASQPTPASIAEEPEALFSDDDEDGGEQQPLHTTNGSKTNDRALNSHSEWRN